MLQNETYRGIFKHCELLCALPKKVARKVHKSRATARRPCAAWAARIKATGSNVAGAAKVNFHFMKDEVWRAIHSVALTDRFLAFSLARLHSMFSFLLCDPPSLNGSIVWIISWSKPWWKCDPEWSTGTPEYPIWPCPLEVYEKRSEKCHWHLLLHFDFIIPSNNSKWTYVDLSLVNFVCANKSLESHFSYDVVFHKEYVESVDGQ